MADNTSTSDQKKTFDSQQLTDLLKRLFSFIGENFKQNVLYDNFATFFANYDPENLNPERILKIKKHIQGNESLLLNLGKFTTDEFNQIESFFL